MPDDALKHLPGSQEAPELGRSLTFNVYARTVRHWQLEGVTVLDPATTWIDVTATLAPDVTVLPNTHILRATTIATRAQSVLRPDGASFTIGEKRCCCSEAGTANTSIATIAAT